MAQFFDPLLIMSLALNFVALGVSRIRGVINAVAAQGILLGILALFIHPDIGLRGILLVIVTIILKGFVIPRFLVHAMREARNSARGQADRRLHELAPPRSGGHRVGDGVLVHAPPGRRASAPALGAGLVVDSLDRLPAC